MSASKSARWFIGVYHGDRAKSIKAHSEAGIGYIVLNEDGQGQKYAVRAAFRLPNGIPQPQEGRFATPEESSKLEQRQRRTQGLKA